MMLVSLIPAEAGRWNISRANVTLFRDLSLGPAITLAREIARDEHLRRRHDICVEMPGADGPIRLALYAKLPPGATDVSSGDFVAA